MERNEWVFGTMRNERSGADRSEKKHVENVMTKKKDRSEGSQEKRDLAASFLMAAGCIAILAFFLFASFGKNVEADVYSNYANDEKNSAISVFSQIVYPDGRVEKSDEIPFDARTSADSSHKSGNNYADVENVVSKKGDTWNFWQYLCDSLAEIFGVTNAE